MKIASLKEIIARIKQETNISIVKGNTKSPQLPLPYGVYNITSPYIKGRGKGAVTQYTNDSGTFEKRTEHYKFIISFSFFAIDNETTIELAMKVHQWFLFIGQEFIQEKELVVISVGSIQNRTTFLVDDYEYKHGFDVQFSATDEQIRQLTESMETINVGGM